MSTEADAATLCTTHTQDSSKDNDQDQREHGASPPGHDEASQSNEYENTQARHDDSDTPQEVTPVVDMDLPDASPGGAAAAAAVTILADPPAPAASAAPPTAAVEAKESHVDSAEVAASTINHSDAISAAAATDNAAAADTKESSSGDRQSNYDERDEESYAHFRPSRLGSGLSGMPARPRPANLPFDLVIYSNPPARITSTGQFGHLDAVAVRERYASVCAVRLLCCHSVHVTQQT